jgi:PadR family transcriptional regulator, regulatory protein PadR
MSDKDFLGELEQMVLLAVLRLRGKGYAVSIREEIQSRTGRELSRGSVYITLDRLESKGYVHSWLADPTPMRGGRAKRYYEVQDVAIPLLKESRLALLRLWRGLESVLA